MGNSASCSGRPLVMCSVAARGCSIMWTKARGTGEPPLKIRSSNSEVRKKTATEQVSGWVFGRISNFGVRASCFSGRHVLVMLAALAFLTQGCKSWHDFKTRAGELRGSLFDSSYDDPRAREKFNDAIQLYADGKYEK